MPRGVRGIAWSEIPDAIAGMNLNGLRLALKHRQAARLYLSHCLRKYDELVGRGLRQANPMAYICEQRWGAVTPEDRIVLPTRLDMGGGVGLDELLLLGAVTRLLRPKKIFEIGTYTGRTTSVFALNAPADATIMTLDLPPESWPTDEMAETYIDSDLELVRARKLGMCLRYLGLEHRCELVLCDSLQFDPSPHRGSVELGFIDGAHALPYVKNDTVKMAVMAADRGLVFWHDYGGKGRFRPLTLYLEELARTIPVYQIYGTTLAWCGASDLRRLAPGSS